MRLPVWFELHTLAWSVVDVRTTELRLCAVTTSFHHLDWKFDNVAEVLTACITDRDVTARWSPDRKWESVSVDPSGTVATKTGEETYGYIQTAQAVSEGVHTW